MPHRKKQKYLLIKDLSEVAGHRKRLRDRFLQGELDGFLDYEVIELLLTLGTPRRDCKQIAKEAIERFEDLRGVLDVSFEELQQIRGIGPMNIFGLKFFQAISERCAKERIPKKTPLTPPELVADIYERGIVLCGGGSLLQGFDQIVAKEAEIPVRVADDPTTCTIRGINILLDDDKVLNEILLPSANDEKMVR